MLPEGYDVACTAWVLLRRIVCVTSLYSELIISFVGLSFECNHTDSTTETGIPEVGCNNVADDQRMRCSCISLGKLYTH